MTNTADPITPTTRTVAWSATPLRVGPVQPGDTISLLGRSHIVRVVGERTNGFGEPIADCVDGWSISTEAGCVEIPSPNSRSCVLATGGAA